MKIPLILSKAVNSFRASNLQNNNTSLTKIEDLKSFGLNYNSKQTIN
jgi:hypothetical protein